MPDTASDLAGRLADNAEAVCRHYLSNGRREGRWWTVGDIYNTPGRSMMVRLKGTDRGRAGKWTDAATGEHGDLLDLIALAQRCTTLADTFEDARRFLRLPQPKQYEPIKPAPQGSPEAARRLFAMSEPIRGTVAEAYLRTRGITDFRDCTSLRFHPRCYCRGDEADPTDAARDAWPALIAAATDLTGAINVLSELLPEFMQRYPSVDANLDLSSRPAEMVAERIDVAIRMGPMPDSQIVARKLGILNRCCCASPGYLQRRGTPKTFEDLREHDLIDLPVRDGRKFTWVFSRNGEVVEHRQAPRLAVNCALTIHKILLNGGGIGLSSGYLCAPEFESGRLVRLFSDWTVPSVLVHAVSPSQRQLAPTVRAFVDFMIEQSQKGHHWQRDH